MALLSCRGLTRLPFFVGWNLDLAPGERAVLSGPSGSGKTLLLRALADLDPLDAPHSGIHAARNGEAGPPSGPMESGIRLLGRSRESFTPDAWRRQVLYLHPTAPRFEGTVASNLKRTARREPVPNTLPGLSGDLDAQTLSSGEGQLLALHRALALGPHVLLLDEPTSALDPERSRAVEQTLVAWCGRDRALVWISHDPELATRIGGRAISLA